MTEEREDELALLDAMKKNDNEFQWVTNGTTVEGIMSIELELPNSLISLQLGEDVRGGHYNDDTVDVSHLPPLKLHFQLKDTYPIKTPPTFSLASSWLNFSQLSILCGNLDQLWSENYGGAILHHWQQFLSIETCTVLNIEQTLVLNYQNPTKPQKDWDPRAVQEMKTPSKLIPFLTRYNHKRKKELFDSSWFSCDICYTSVIGSSCISLQACKHVHCKECTIAHVTAKINDGSVTKIECPSSDCNEEIPSGLIQNLIPQSLFQRYDKILLQRTLESMSDIVYCPRPTCRSVTIKEEDSNMGICPSCKFAFCVMCKRTWHGISPCKVLPEDIQELKSVYESGDTDVRKSLEQQYGRQYLIHAFQEYDSSKWLKGNTKPCPNCRASIEKDHGCNKMSCYNCNCNFCWLCHSILPRHNPYGHYHPGSSQCSGKLFEGEIPEE